MPTTLPRVLVPVSRITHAVLTRRAKQDGVSVAAVARSLMDRALELDEDIMWAKLADGAEKKSKRSYTLDEAERELKRRRQ